MNAEDRITRAMAHDAAVALRHVTPPEQPLLGVDANAESDADGDVQEVVIVGTAVPEPEPEPEPAPPPKPEDEMSEDELLEMMLTEEAASKSAE